jgi:predicted lysophospholipase L1 biosynthesis ABC-type transport system permease subunit
MTLAGGRYFSSDEYQNLRNVVVVNERLASVGWPGQNALGKRMKWGPATSPASWLTVVGVVRDVADGPVGTPPGIHAYEPFRQMPDFFLNTAPNQFGRDVKVLVLAEQTTVAIAPLVRRQIAELDPELAVDRLTSMDEQITDAVAPQRFSATVVTAFAAVGLLLASVGLYGLLAFIVGQRQKEIAVRMALGADRGAVVWMVVRNGMRLMSWGLAFGMVAAAAAVRLASSLAYQPDPLGVATFAIIPLALVPAALLACAIPAWRAACMDPVVALRAE